MQSVYIVVIYNDISNAGVFFLNVLLFGLWNKGEIISEHVYLFKSKEMLM